MITQIEPEVYTDWRGGVTKMYSSANEISCLKNPQQLLLSHTKLKNTFRGFHFQLPPNLEKKMIFPLKGAATWLSLDMRAGPDFKRLYIMELDFENPLITILEAGLAHAMISRTDDVSLLISSSESINNNSIEFSVNDPLINELIGHLMPGSFKYDTAKQYVSFESCVDQGLLPI